MAKEGIEDDLRGPRIRGAPRVGLVEHLGDELELIADGLALTRALDMTHGRGNRRLATRRAAGRDAVTLRRQLLDDLLSNPIELADRQEEAACKPRIVHGAEHEGRLAEAAELVAELRLVERTLRRRNERDITTDRAVAVAGGCDDLDRRACGSEHTQVESFAPALPFRRHRREARAGSLH